MFESKVLREMFGCKGGELTGNGENHLRMGFTVCHFTWYC